MEDVPEYYARFSDRYLEAIDNGALLNFLFSFGGATKDGVGACIRVVAYTPEEAIEKVRAMLEDFREYNGTNIHDYTDVEYFTLYFNPEQIDENDIVFSETEIA